jgi:hypothetical protein
MAWKEVSEKRYDEMLGVLPPALWLGKGFLVGEPHDHRRCRVSRKVMPTYAAFAYAFGRYYEGDPMTFAEFQTFDVNDLPVPNGSSKNTGRRNLRVRLPGANLSIGAAGRNAGGVDRPLRSPLRACDPRGVRGVQSQMAELLFFHEFKRCGFACCDQ